MRIAESMGPAATKATEARETAKLVDGARQFEGMLLGEMLKGLNFSGAPGEDAAESEGGASGTIRSFGTEALAKAVATGGGFGIARQIVRQVKAEKHAQDQGRGTEVKAL